MYVAENHENLHHILVFFTITGGKACAELHAEVLPLDQSSEQGDQLVIKCGPHTSRPLSLPACTTPGKKEVRDQNTHFEIKLPTTDSKSPFSDINGQPAPLLDATKLSSINPSSFLCASCSLPLIQSSKVSTYRDLPSEHWEELVEAWMCHSDQKLHVTKNGKRGFWPSPGQALVGGCYILFEESAMNRNNFHMKEEPAVRFFFLISLFSFSGVKKTGDGIPPLAVADKCTTLGMAFSVFLKPLPVLRRFNWSCFTADEHDRHSVLVDTRRPRKKAATRVNNSCVERGSRHGSYP